MGILQKAGKKTADNLHSGKTQKKYSEMAVCFKGKYQINFVEIYIRHTKGKGEFVKTYKKTVFLKVYRKLTEREKRSLHRPAIIMPEIERNKIAAENNRWSIGGKANVRFVSEKRM